MELSECFSPTSITRNNNIRNGEDAMITSFHCKWIFYQLVKLKIVNCMLIVILNNLLELHTSKLKLSKYFIAI